MTTALTHAPCKYPRTEFTRAKVFIWQKVDPARRVTLPSKEGNPSSGLPF